MINFEATANTGMEAVLKREVQALGLEDIRVVDGLVSMSGNMEDMARLNLHLRTAERVHWVLKRFRATTFKTEKPGTIFALSMCNIHGLWENALELK